MLLADAVLHPQKPSVYPLQAPLVMLLLQVSLGSCCSALLCPALLCPALLCSALLFIFCPSSITFVMAMQPACPASSPWAFTDPDGLHLLQQTATLTPFSDLSANTDLAIGYHADSSQLGISKGSA